MKSSYLIAYTCFTPADVELSFLFVCAWCYRNPKNGFIFLQNQQFLPGWTARQMFFLAVEGRG